MAPEGCSIRAGAFGTHVFPIKIGGFIWSLKMAPQWGCYIWGLYIGGGGSSVLVFWWRRIS